MCPFLSLFGTHSAPFLEHLVLCSFFKTVFIKFSIFITKQTVRSTVKTKSTIICHQTIVTVRTHIHVSKRKRTPLPPPSRNMQQIMMALAGHRICSMLYVNKRKINYKHTKRKQANIQLPHSLSTNNVPLHSLRQTQIRVSGTPMGQRLATHSPPTRYRSKMPRSPPSQNPKGFVLGTKLWN